MGVAIREADIKKLWGLAAGRCSFPGCELPLIQLAPDENPVVIGEMAHVIARSPFGPRGQSQPVDNTYVNLILLCPTHHALVDNAPSVFTPQLLLKWKVRHEATMRTLKASTADPSPLQGGADIAEYQVLNSRNSYWLVIRWALSPLLLVGLTFMAITWHELGLSAQTMMWVALGLINMTLIADVTLGWEIYNNLFYLHRYIHPRIGRARPSRNPLSYEAYLQQQIPTQASEYSRYLFTISGPCPLMWELSPS